ncbi:MAG: hypothetical protein GWN87_18195, partial [Desulfuromonadales bacterium]|nr:hypothetical protein [Desulfuromonadales bacterium]NIS39643.1 hypothetical protein [Desulfuromonadales bacterium]
MSLQLQEVALALDEPEAMLNEKIAARLGLAVGEISNVRILRRGIDARKKPDVKRVYTVAFDVEDEER